jgi:hypothetical protein
VLPYRFVNFEGVGEERLAQMTTDGVDFPHENAAMR